MEKNNLIIGIIGSTGAVGLEIINTLSLQNIKFNKLLLFSRSHSSIETLFGTLESRPFELSQAVQCDIIFLATNSDFSKKYAQILAEKSIVIDNSSAFRYESNIPLIIPEINGHLIKNHKLISNPNCTTAIALMVLYPIYLCYGLKKVIISTYQAASGAGKEGTQELIESIENKLVENKVFTRPLAYNVIPHIDSFLENGYTKEEMKVVWETRKILNDDQIQISCTAVRIPVIRAHSESITIETKNDVDLDELKNILNNTEGVKLVDDIENNIYPTPLEFSNVNEVGVGRIRKNLIYGNKGIDLFICGDQLLRGAALNAVLIAQYMMK